MNLELLIRLSVRLDQLGKLRGTSDVRFDLSAESRNEIENERARIARDGRRKGLELFGTTHVQRRDVVENPRKPGADTVDVTQVSEIGRRALTTSG